MLGAGSSKRPEKCYPLEVPLMIAYDGRPATHYYQVKCYAGVGGKEDSIEDEQLCRRRHDNPMMEEKLKRQAPALEVDLHRQAAGKQTGPMAIGVVASAVVRQLKMFKLR
jgi:hypothetical protein